MTPSAQVSVYSLAISVVLAAMPMMRAAAESLDELVAAAKAEGSVMIYHTSAVRTFRPVFTAFAKKYGITVRNFYATGTPCRCASPVKLLPGPCRRTCSIPATRRSLRTTPATFQVLNADTLAEL